MMKVVEIKSKRSRNIKLSIVIVFAILISASVGCDTTVREVHQDDVTQVVEQVSSDGNCLYGCPVGKPQNTIIEREIYTLSNNAETKFADWVAYHVTTETIGPSKSRNWKADPDLSPEDTLEPDDYRGANAALKTDRGHQVPLASFSGTDYWAMTNYLSNITPQKSNLNQGAWVKLENAVRNAVKNGTDLYVMTGPIYYEDIEKLPQADEEHVVPSGYWKVVADDNGSVTAFIFDQDLPRSADYCDLVVFLRDVEAVTGFDLFPVGEDWIIDDLKAELGCL